MPEWVAGKLMQHHDAPECVHGVDVTEPCTQCIVMGESRTTQERADTIADDLHDFWLKLAHEEIAAVVPKAVQYGAADLAVMGKAMEMLLPEDKRHPTLGLEMACAFYALGKVARAFGAYEQGEPASDDDWHDLGVYCRMVQKVRRTGRWV